MKRDITFVKPRGVLAEALGLDRDMARFNELETFTRNLIDQDKSLREIITALNERGDLTDAEWTNAMYTLGWYTCIINGGVSYR
jgi:hypothetical protein